MAYNIMIALTDEKFVCVNVCEHSDCESLKNLVNSAVCKNCEKKIEEGDSYYGSKIGELEHVYCDIKS